MLSIIFQALIFPALFYTSSSYTSVKLEDGNVCSLDSNSVSIKLYHGSQSAVVLTEEDYFARWTGRYNFKCNFLVQAKDNKINDGIYAVFQNLQFRRNFTTGECIDYIEFSVPPNDISKILGTGNVKTKRFCGHMSPSTPFDFFNFEDGGNVAPNGYVAKGSELAVEIYIATKRLSAAESLHFTIAFTAFKRECYKERRGLKQCTPGQCIWEGLFSDNIQNCPQKHCPDEDGCEHLGHTYGREEFEYPSILFDSPSYRSGFEVTISAIASTVVLFLLFAGCMCICKRSQTFCWAPRPVRPRAPAPPAAPEDVERVLPSAPPEPQIKDAPPSYESLFPPETTTTTNTTAASS